MKSYLPLWPAVIVASAAATGLMALLGIQGPVRALVTIGFLCTGPGMALVPLLRLEHGWVNATLAVAVSLALDSIVAESMLYARVWSPGWGLAALIGLSVAGAGLQVLTVGPAAAKEQQRA